MNYLLLKTLCDGLPYGLKLQVARSERHNETGITKLIPAYLSLSSSMIVKPCMRDMSDLTVEIEHNGERFVPIERMNSFFKEDSECDFQIEWDYNEGSIWMCGSAGQMGLWEAKKLIDLLSSMHFNWRGLPEDQYVKVTNEFNPYK